MHSREPKLLLGGSAGGGGGGGMDWDTGRGVGGTE